MKLLTTPMFFCTTIWMFFQGFSKSDELCSDASTHCSLNKCNQPGIADHCQKTCGRCIDGDECQPAHYKVSNGTCASCKSIPRLQTDYYKQSCGCPPGKWGPPGCNNTCSIGCVDDNCDVNSGVCVKGCKPCYHNSPYCNQVPITCDCSNPSKCVCKTGYYGKGCTEKCPDNCKKKVCNEDGNCTLGCIAEMYGAKCDKSCQNCMDKICSLDDGHCSNGCKIGYYGGKCSVICSNNCIDHLCHQMDGDCVKGCNSGWYSNKCNKRCPPRCYTKSCNRSDGSCPSCRSGFYGYHCNMTCPDKCAELSCNQNGSCVGCKKGHRGSQCQKHCPKHCTVCDQYDQSCSICASGWYGNTCQKECGACLNDSCAISSGQCVNGCKVGYYNKVCKTPCNVNCLKRNNRTYCDQNTGKCSDGCTVGWFGERCDRKCNSACKDDRCERINGTCTRGCVDTLYGLFCNNTCSDHCSMKLCHTGKPDRKSPICTHRCEDNWWGDYCDSKCPHHCLKCHKANGSCLKCEGNRYESNCTMPCSKNCFKSSCSMTGVCIGGCIKGLWGSLCNETCPKDCRWCNITNGQCGQCKDSYYGSNCTSCSTTCRQSQCNMTGSCTEGCQDGYHGNRCELSCAMECRSCHQYSGVCLSCTEGWEYHDMLCTESTRKRTFWIAIPCLLITALLLLAVVVIKRSKKEKRRIISSTESAFSMLTMVNPSYLGTPKGSPNPNEADFSETQSMKDTHRGMVVQRRGDTRKKDDPFYTPARMQSYVFNTHIPLEMIHQDVGRSDHQPYPCRLDDEPQLGCLWSTEVQTENFRAYVDKMKGNLGLTNQFFTSNGSVSAVFSQSWHLEDDHSRVKLRHIDGIPCSDYINANYINGYAKPSAFVATQGPYGDVIWDFWRMVWETDSGKIVMLTNFIENRKNKCEQYWPDLGQPKINYDGVFVQCVTEKQLGEYTVRTFTVQLQEETPRTVKQYHFTAWPDRGVPQDVTSLVEFHQTVKQSPAFRYGPIIVHCSAGVGRTGTFLALDYLIAQARVEGVVDVYECVTKLRHQRMDAIQTEEQYIFLHDALVEALSSGYRPPRTQFGHQASKSSHKLRDPRKSEHELTRYPVMKQSPTEEELSRIRRLPHIPLETLSTTFCSTPDRRS